MPDIKKLPFKTYLSVIEHSVGSDMFRQGFAEIDGQKTDIMRNGELSCAFYVSSVLSIFNVINSMHATVSSTVKDLEDSGWKRTKQPEEGDVIVWQAVMFPNGEEHEHIGFVVSPNQAISNDYVKGTPQKHDFRQTPDGTTRGIEAVYRGRHLFEPNA